MSSLHYEDETGPLGPADELARDVKDLIRTAREARKQWEPTWHSNLAYAAGKFNLKWDRTQRRLVEDPSSYGKELYTTDVITEYRTTALGELGTDDDRPALLLRHDDLPSEDFQEQLNKAVSWGWDYEWEGDEALEEMRRLVLDFGTAAIRCRFDPTVGPVIGDVPHVNGLPVHDPQQQTALADQFSQGVIPGVKMKSVQQGRITWEPLTPFNLLVPPGIPHERHFPWECVIRPALLSSVKAEYGDTAAALREDKDIGSLYGFDTTEANAQSQNTYEGKRSRVEGHVWLFTFYEKPCPKYPNGRTVTLATNDLKVLEIEDKLPYEKPDGSYASGLAYFHWWRVTGRFWSRALVESMKDPQRSINKRRSQINEIIDRGLPAIFVQKDSKAKNRRGLANELIEIGQEERQPTVFAGISPGEWMYHDIQEMREDLEHATGIRGPRLGENPQNVTTYAQPALLNENDQVKRSNILREQKQGIARLVELAVHDIRTYWGSSRQLMIASEDDKLEAMSFDASQTPTFVMVKVAKGAALPRSQAAELKKIEELWNASLGVGATVMNPIAWLEWLKDSLEAGQALDFPQDGSDEHADKAELENYAIEAGELPPVQYYDPSTVHIPIHREAQIEAEQGGDLELWMLFEQHIQAHVLQDAETARQMQKITGGFDGQPGAEMPMEEGPPDEPQAV